MARRKAEESSTLKTLFAMGIAMVGLAAVIYLQFNTWQASLIVGGILILVGGLGSALMWRHR